MKKLLTILFLFISILANSQDIAPTGINFKSIPTHSFKYYTPTEAVWMYKGSTYGWTNLAKGLDSLQYYRMLNNHDSLSTLQEKSYNSLNDKPNLSVYAPIDNPIFTTKITTPALNIPTSATINYFWKCINATTGEGQWTAVSSSAQYKGAYDASGGGYGSPALTDGTGTLGDYYTCTVAGTVNTNHGNITLAVGDQMMYNGSIWEKIPVSIAINLTGPITSTGNATSIASQTGTGSTFAMSESPTFTGAVVLPSTTSIGNVSATELGYIDGVTSAIQTQLGLKAPLASPIFTGFVTSPQFVTQSATATDGQVIMNTGNATSQGWVGWYRPNGVRSAYMGAGTTDLLLVLENSSNLGILGGNVGIGTSVSGGSLHVSAANVNSDLTAIHITNTSGNTYALTSGIRSANERGFSIRNITDATIPFFILPNDNITINGGLHVGGGSDAGDNNLLVDGVITATGGTSTQWNAKEPALGNPGTTGFVLSSTIGGTRSWIAPIVYPGAGIALSSGSAWSGSITNNSANWNIAYGWGNHASVGYAANNQTFFMGTTQVAINRSSAALTLAGITLTTPNIGTPSAGTLTNCTFPDNWLINSGNDVTSGTLTATNFILSSDRRLKTNIKSITDLSRFDKIKFVQFNLKSDPTQLRFGVIAQQIESIAPELIRTDNAGMKSVAYIDLLIIKIAELESRIIELEKHEK